MDWLNEILSEYVEEEKLEEVVDKFKKESPKYLMPKDKFNEVNEQLKIKNQQLEDTKKEMKVLSEKAENLEDYEEKIKDLNTKLEETEKQAQQKIQSITKTTQLKEMLLENNAHKQTIDLLVNAYLDKAELDEDGIKNKDELLKTIKSERDGLFIKTDAESKDKDSDKDAQSSKDRSKMTMEEYLEDYKKRQQNKKPL